MEITTDGSLPQICKNLESKLKGLDLFILDGDVLAHDLGVAQILKDSVS